MLVLLLFSSSMQVLGAERSRAETLRDIQQFLQQGNLEEADQQLAMARKQFPRDPAFCDLLGVVKAEKGDYRGAESNFRMAIEFDPLLAGAYLNLGHLYMQNAAVDHDAPQKALAVYGRLLKFQPQNAEALYQSAVLLERRKAYRESLTHLDKLPQASQERGQVLSIRLADVVGLHRRAQANVTAEHLLNSPDLSDEDVSLVLPGLEACHWDDFEQMLLLGGVKRRPKSCRLLSDLGGFYFRVGKLGDARVALEKAATIEPQSVEILLQLARVADKQKDFTGALGFLAHVRDLAPKDPAIHFFFGIVALEENLLEEAYKSLKQAVSLAPENADYEFALGIVAQNRADPDEAVPYFKKYCALRPHDPRGRLQLGISDFEAHQDALAQKELETVVQYSETAPAAQFFLGRIANQEGKPSEALQHLRSALRADPNYADPYAEEGIIYMKQKNYGAAGRAMRRALALEPDHYVANLNLMILYERTGDKRAAEQARRFEEVRKKRAEAGKLALRGIRIVR